MENEITIKSLLPSKRTLPDRGVTYVGIDFGTSTTVASIAHYDEDKGMIQVETIPIEQRAEDGALVKSKLVPSVIALYNNTILVGEGANYLKYTLPKHEQIWYSFKMELGEDLSYYSSVLGGQNIPSQFAIRTPQDAASVFFQFLKNKIEAYCKEKGISTDIKYAVSIPASFEANQRKDLVEALRRNNMTVERQSLIDEPNAAFLSYIQENAVSDDNSHKIVVQNTYNPKVLVFDFGGGTCDISILEVGKGLNGFYSKNLSISKFEKLGGDDIDRYISFHYLLPQLLEANGKSLNEFRTPDKRMIASQLFKIAEQLKILISTDIANMKGSSTKLPVLINSDSERNVNMRVDIDTKQGHLIKDGFTLSYKQFTETMNVFLKNPNSRFSISKNRYVTKVKGEEDYNSIFNPLTSALKKAHIDKDKELDYILFIGGSSKNPYIQTALADYFSESELLIPSDLQTHVSKGAAIHSLVMNGFGKNIIQPITSEPIIVLTKGEGEKILIPAGVSIPCPEVTCQDLITSRDGQSVVELPICVGNKDKMLFNVRIPAPNGTTFRAGEEITLKISITADKLLHISAMCRGSFISPEELNPFANKEMTTEERNIIRCEREIERSKAANSGTPSKRSIEELVTAYREAGNQFQAAETMEMEEDFYPNSISYNELAILYSNSGNRDRAIAAYERDLEKSPSATVYNNLSLEYRFRDWDKFREYSHKAHEMRPSEPLYMMNYARSLEHDGKTLEAKRLQEEAYELYLKRFRSHNMRSWDYSWFSSLARELGHADVAAEVSQAEPTIKKKAGFNEENLSQAKNVSIEYKKYE